MMLHVIEHFANSLEVVENGTIWKLGYSFLFAFHSNLLGSQLSLPHGKWSRWWCTCL